MNQDDVGLQRDMSVLAKSLVSGYGVDSRRGLKCVSLSDTVTTWRSDGLQ